MIPRPIIRSIGILAPALVLSTPIGARAGAAPPAAEPQARAERRAWYVPDHAKLQLAGSIGFLSPGVGYQWLERRVEADLFLGWVPPRFAGEPIVSLTGKLGIVPWHLRIRGWEVRPVTAAVQLTYTVGDEYWLRQPDRYPAGYYPVPTALRSGVALGTAVGRPAAGLEHVGLYCEVVAIDAMLGHWLDNQATIGPLDVFTLAVGARADL